MSWRSWVKVPLRVTHQQARNTYRPDIDGLRAVAIISVVGFHVRLPGFAGGFVGVDVFFVISGYLITTLLLDELRARGSIDLLAFFARRARRLLPAFLLMVVATIVLGFYFLLPISGEQQRLAGSATAAAFYMSNFYFGRAGDDYFDPDSSSYPLLHTWSLAVEEQFYLLWPLMLLGGAWVASRGRLSLTWMIAGLLAVVFIASLGYGWWVATSGPREAKFAFFALHARAWELGTGALLALVLPALRRSNGWSAALLTAAGTIGIGAAVVMFHSEMPFLSTALLLPTLSAAAVIAGAWLTPNGITARLLASRPLIVIGLLSYSWYLWHWPLLAIARAHALGVEDMWRDGAIAIAAFGLAWLTYVVVEEPVRSRRVGRSWSNLRVLSAGAVASLLIIASAQGLHMHARQLAETETFKQLVQVQDDEGWSRKDCRNRRENFRRLVPRSKCLRKTGQLDKLLVVWGDSHADHLIGMFEGADKAGRFSVLPRWMPGCPPLLHFLPLEGNGRREACARFNRAVLAEIGQLQSQDALAGVVLSAAWPNYRDEPAPFHKAGLAESEAGQDAFVNSLRTTLEELTARDIKILVVAPTPEQPFEVPVCLARRSPYECSVSLTLAQEHRRRALQAMQSAIGDSKNIYLWDALPALCSGDRCLAKRDGIVIYRDKSHLSYSGSRWLAPYLQRSSVWRAIVGEEPVGLSRSGG